ncbi:Rrf2 family transcriptional regulator [Ferrovibrio sp.]|uniref:RrF2 family transcriptional regulator n=1 Tax=Ferrovibrio sp. TaxID=1917215 RepID=UPI00312051F3
MLKCSRRTMHALEAVVDIAFHARPEPVQSKDIAARQNVPQRYLEQVMQHLVRNGVLKGVRGPRGGYTLARERRRITVGEIVRIVTELDADGEESFLAGSELGRRTVQPIWDECQASILARIDKITMEELCARAEGAGLEAELEGADNFTI